MDPEKDKRCTQTLTKFSIILNINMMLRNYIYSLGMEQICEPLCWNVITNDH